MTLHVVGNFEQNMYHDSYFHAVYWDDEAKNIVKKEIGATAYGGGLLRLPLTENTEVWKEVEAYKKALRDEAQIKIRKDKADRLRAARKILKDNGVHTAFTNRLELRYLEDIAALFSNRVRNNFKLKMREQVKAWTPDSEYKTPLSPKQMECILRPLKDAYGRETKRAAEVYKHLEIKNKVNRELRGVGQR